MQVGAKPNHLRHAPQLQEAAWHFGQFLSALGLSLSDPHLVETPERVAKMYAEMLGGGEPYTFTTFDHDEDLPGGSGPIIVRDIPVTSFCSHHLLPFTGVAHVGYIPSTRIAGLSKLARVVNQYAKRPQVQERLTGQIADHLSLVLEAEGVAVLISARHSCMELRGARAVGSSTVTTAFRGSLAESPWRDHFLSEVRRI